MHEEALIHGTCLAIGRSGVLILGPPGAGKSDLALRLIDQAGSGTAGRLKRASLVADDQVQVKRQGNRLVASAPKALKGKLEVRGLGIASVKPAGPVRLRLAVRLTSAATIERLPELERNGFSILGLSLPLALIDPERPSAPARVRAALDWFGTG